MNDLKIEDIYKAQWRLDNPDPPTNFEKVQEFHNAMGTTRRTWPPTQEELILRSDLIWEELNELMDEFVEFNPDQIDKKKIAKELADLLYVVYGTADSFGIPIDDVFAEVHRSNMSKLVDGKPLKREDGKVLKGPNYTPPNFDWIEK